MNKKKTTYSKGFNNEIGSRYLLCTANSLQYKPPCAEIFLLDTQKITQKFYRKSWFNYINSDNVIEYHKFQLFHTYKMGIEMYVFENDDNTKFNSTIAKLLELQRDLERQNKDDLLYLKQIKKL